MKLFRKITFLEASQGQAIYEKPLKWFPNPPVFFNETHRTLISEIDKMPEIWQKIWEKPFSEINICSKK